MNLASLLTSLPLLIGATAAPVITTPMQATERTVCEIIKTARRRPRDDELVSITAGAYYDFEHGYFLEQAGCADSVDGTGLLRIELPAASRVEDFPELAKLSSQAWLTGAAGKKPHCICVGFVSFKHGSVTFTLTAAKAVWASD